MESISLRGNGWKKFFALMLVWMAAALLAPAQTLTTLHSFSFDDGALPEFATPTQGRDGNTYSTSSVGGSSTTCGLGCGTAFKITPQGTLTSFSLDGTDGAIPDAGLVLARDGRLYGTTSSGGASGNGEVFRLNPQTGALTVLHSFVGSDGANPEAAPTLGPGGKYYGTTNTGGANNFGTVFSITTSGIFESLRAGDPQPTDGRVEPGVNRDPALSPATRTRQKSRNRSRGCGPGRSRAYVGRAKRQSFYLHRCIGLLDLVGRGGFWNRGAHHPVERSPP